MSAIDSQTTNITADPAGDDRGFRRCLGQYPTGVTVITASTPSGPVGITCNSFSALSLDPPLILWSIRKESSNFEAFTKADLFAVHILSEHQVDISFALSQSDPNKFSKVFWTPSEQGVPLLQGCSAVLHCRRQACLEGGDHTIILGHVNSYDMGEQKPLIFAQGSYKTAVHNPPVNQLPSTERDPSAKGVGDTLLNLLFHAYHATFQRYERYLSTEPLTHPERRILASLYGSARQSQTAIEQATFLGRREAQEALEKLMSLSLVKRDTNGTFSLTENGIDRRRANITRSRQFEVLQLDGFNTNETELLKRFLCRLGSTD